MVRDTSGRSGEPLSLWGVSARLTGRTLEQPFRRCLATVSTRVSWPVMALRRAVSYILIHSLPDTKNREALEVSDYACLRMCIMANQNQVWSWVKNSRTAPPW